MRSILLCCRRAGSLASARLRSPSDEDASTVTLSLGKAAFVEAVFASRPLRALEVGVGAGEATSLLRDGLPSLTTVDLDPRNGPDVNADICALPFSSAFDTVCTDTLINQLGSRLARGLAELTRVTREPARLVLREWLPPRGDGPRDQLLQAMLAARLLDGDDYTLHHPQVVDGVLSGLGWHDIEWVEYDEPQDSEPFLLYPLDQRRHDRLRPPLASDRRGIASSYVLTALSRP